MEFGGWNFGDVTKNALKCEVSRRFNHLQFLNRTK